MEYWKEACLSALSDTWAIVVGSKLSALLVSIVILATTWIVYRRFAGPQAAKEYVIGTFSLLIATFLIGLVLFISTILFVTPVKFYGAQKRLTDDLQARLDIQSERNSVLVAALERRKHAIETSDPVFPNIIYLLQAFRMYRVSLGSEAKCTVYITAPPDSVSTASLVAQVSIATSNCATFGPHGREMTPTLEKEALDGSIPSTVIVHAPEHDRAADELYKGLTSVFNVKRGYKTISQGRLAEIANNYIWLQFGTGTGFSTELRQSDAKANQQ